MFFGAINWCCVWEKTVSSSKSQAGFDRYPPTCKIQHFFLHEGLAEGTSHMETLLILVF